MKLTPAEILVLQGALDSIGRLSDWTFDTAIPCDLAPGEDYCLVCTIGELSQELGVYIEDLLEGLDGT